VLWKAFDVLGAFSHRRRVLTLSEISRYSGLPKSTAHRVLFMLIEVGAVEQVPDGYQVGLRMFSLGVLPPEAALREAALPHLEELHRVTGHTLHLAILRGADVVYLEKLLPRGTSVVMPSVIGDRMPATVTGVGKVLLAFSSPEERAAALAGPLPRRTARSLGTLEALHRELDTIRERGYALDREEAAVGVSCVAVPILPGPAVTGPGAIAAISVSYPASSGSGQALISPLRETATAIARSPMLRRSVLSRSPPAARIRRIPSSLGRSSLAPSLLSPLRRRGLWLAGGETAQVPRKFCSGHRDDPLRVRTVVNEAWQAYRRKDRSSWTRTRLTRLPVCCSAHMTAVLPCRR
jgi:DNA-binding IclR family transcriptional regulator